MSATYVKLHYGVTDFSAGIQSVNQLRDNFQADYDALSAEHSPLEFSRGQPNRNSALTFGRHNTPKVPRAVVKTSLFNSGFAIVLPGAIIAQPVVTGVSRVSAGVFFIGITDLQQFYAEVEATQDASTSERFVMPRTNIGGNGVPPGITIECYEKASAGAGFDLTDYDFSAVIYGTTA